MAQPSISDTFITKLQELARQNASVDEVLQQNNLFNNMVKTDLNEINQKILRITEEIKKLQTRLAETLNKVASNEDDIKANITASEDLARQLSDITAEREQASTALAANQQEIDALRAAAAETDTQYRADLARLEAEKEAEILAMRNKTGQEKETLQMQLQDTDSKIANLEKSHEKESSALRFQLAQLNARTSQLEEYLTESDSKFTEATAKVEELNARNKELILENDSLNRILDKAIPIIEDAKNKLNALSDNTTNQAEINDLISKISESLNDINILLEIDSRSIPSAASDQFYVENPMGVRVSRPPGSLIKPNIYNSVVRKPNLLNENFTIDGKNYTLQEIIRTLKTNPDLMKNTTFLKKAYHNIYDANDNSILTTKTLIEQLNANNDKDSVQYIINDLIDPSKFEKEYNLLEEESNSLDGGKRIRKTRKTKKIRRRKTKKVQRGGYHYNERAKRRSITTTSSKRTSKRSSKRNKRTSSI